MEITYLGHSAFKLKGKSASLVTDPFDKKTVGFAMPKVSADVVTVSHEHPDHNAISRVSGTSRRQEPYIINAPGEYEVNGIGVFGWGSFHDNSGGKERGKNTMYSIVIDGVMVCHLGDLGHKLTDDQVAGLGVVDVLLVPVGGFYTISPDVANEVIQQLQPSWVVPMHYKTASHSQEQFEKVLPLENFLKVMGQETAKTMDKLVVKAGETLEETEIIVLKAKEESGSTDTASE